MKRRQFLQGAGAASLLSLPSSADTAKSKKRVKERKGNVSVKLLNPAGIHKPAGYSHMRRSPEGSWSMLPDRLPWMFRETSSAKMISVPKSARFLRT